MMTPFMMAALLEAVPMCFSSDVKQLCCPSACGTKNSPKWTQANDVLRGCMRGLGCGDTRLRVLQWGCGEGRASTLMGLWKYKVISSTEPAVRTCG